MRPLVELVMSAGLTRREVLRNGVLLGAAAAIAPHTVFSEENRDSDDVPHATLRRDVSLHLARKDFMSLRHEDMLNEEKLMDISRIIVGTYVEHAGNSYISPDELLDGKKLTIYTSTAEFRKGVESVDPTYQWNSGNFGRAHYPSRTIHIDAEKLLETVEDFDYPGIALADVEFHELTHLGIAQRRQGDLLNNAALSIDADPSVENDKWEMWKAYRGGQVITESTTGLDRFEEVFAETVVVRFMTEVLGIDAMISATMYGSYQKLGLDFFPAITRAVGMSFDELNSLHMTSDFEGIAVRIGERLRGNSSPLMRGYNLFSAIHRQDSQMLKKLGAFDLELGAKTA